MDTISEIFLLQEHWLDLKGKNNNNKKEKYIALNERNYYINVFIFVDMMTKWLQIFCRTCFCEQEL